MDGDHRCNISVFLDEGHRRDQDISQVIQADENIPAFRDSYKAVDINPLGYIVLVEL